MQQQYGGWRHTQYKVGTKIYGDDKLADYAFWVAVARAQSIDQLLRIVSSDRRISRRSGRGTRHCTVTFL